GMLNKALRSKMRYSKLPPATQFAVDIWKDLQERTQMKTKKRHYHAVIERLPSGPISGVEVGVWRGEFSRKLLQAFPRLTYYMVDPWQEQTRNKPYFKNRRFTQEE